MISLNSTDNFWSSRIDCWSPPRVGVCHSIPSRLPIRGGCEKDERTSQETRETADMRHPFSVDAPGRVRDRGQAPFPRLWEPSLAPSHSLSSPGSALSRFLRRIIRCLTSIVTNMSLPPGKLSRLGGGSLSAYHGVERSRDGSPRFFSASPRQALTVGLPAGLIITGPSVTWPARLRSEPPATHQPSTPRLMLPRRNDRMTEPDGMLIPFPLTHTKVHDILQSWRRLNQPRR